MADRFSRPADHPDLIDAIADFIAAYRSRGGEAPKMQEAVLAAFPIADGGHYAVALMMANRREREARS